MDRDEAPDIALIDEADIPDLELGDGGDGVRPPDDTRGGGGGGSGPTPHPFLQSHWGAVVPAGLIVLFGVQSLLVLWVSRSGLGSEGVAWLLASVFVVSFTVVFIVGSRYIARHRQ